MCVLASRNIVSISPSQALYEFAWYEYCDWYLELSKPTLQSEQSSDAQKRGTRETLAAVLEAYLAFVTSADALHHRRDLAGGGADGRPQRRHDHVAVLSDCGGVLA